jgi:hypothetical protein
MCSERGQGKIMMDPKENLEILLVQKFETNLIGPKFVLISFSRIRDFVSAAKQNKQTP